MIKHANQPKQTAHEAYVAKHAVVAANLARLQAHLERHARTEENNKSRGDWSYAGDLDYINQMLLQALGEAQ